MKTLNKLSVKLNYDNEIKEINIDLDSIRKYKLATAKDLHDRKIEIEKLQSRIDKTIKFIEKYCIDDEFYINLTYKEKGILEALKILKGDDKE